MCQRVQLVVLSCLIGLMLSQSTLWARDPDADYRAATNSLDRSQGQQHKDTVEELARIRSQLALQQQRTGALQQWTQMNFDIDRQGRIPHPEMLSKYLKRLQKEKDTTLYSLMQFRDQSRGEIKSGHALNFFLDECGPAAMEMAYCRTVGRDKSKQVDADQNEREVLTGMTSNYVLDADTIRQIRYRRGLTGAKLTGRINAKPLDLENMNSVLRHDEFRPQLDDIASFRDEALAELDKGEPVTPQTAGKLMHSVQSLLDDIRAKKKKQAKLSFDAMRPYLQAERQMFALYEGATRLIEAQEPGDVAVEAFRSGTIGDLMAYMQRNNLHFDAADDNGDVAYNNLYTLMTKYYLDLRAMQQAVVESAVQSADAAMRERELTNWKLGHSTSQTRGDLWDKQLEDIRQTIRESHSPSQAQGDALDKKLDGIRDTIKEERRKY